MAYEIRHKTDAEYHLLQFHGTPELLGALDRTLRITDGVVRFRIIKLAPGTPDPPPRRPPARRPSAPAEARRAAPSALPSARRRLAASARLAANPRTIRGLLATTTVGHPASTLGAADPV